MSDLSISPEYMVKAMNQARPAAQESTGYGSDWSASDTAKEAAFAALMAMDYLQTRNIAKRGEEMNPILGKRPGEGKTALYFGGLTALHALGAPLIPKGPWRDAYQLIPAGIQLGAVGRNAHLGYSMRF